MGEWILLLLQMLQVLFLWGHDWVPLGVLNDVAAVRRQNTPPRLIATTLLQSVPFTIGLAGSLVFLGQPYPPWLCGWLRVSYTVLFLGQMFAWWVPYLVRADPARATRYQLMFGRTHSFLPLRRGMVPNTAHILLHIATLCTLLLLFLLPQPKP